MRPLVSLVLALVFVPACSDPSPASEDESSSSSSGDESSSGGESSSSGGCDESEYGWCTETCVVPTGPEAGNLCEVVAYVARAIDCQHWDCWKVVAEVYGGGTYGDGVSNQVLELWEYATLWDGSPGDVGPCLEMPEPSCTVLTEGDCLALTADLTVDEAERNYACREIAARFPTAGLPPAE